jgi:hypothetical protein
MLQSSSFWSNAHAAHHRNIPQYALRVGEMIGEGNPKNQIICGNRGFAELSPFGTHMGNE